VAADANFRNPMMARLLKLIGTIPKTKNMSDLDTVKLIHASVMNNEVVGVFGEGQQTWTGKTMPLIPATIKLIHFLKIPVVSIVTKGGFLSRPRWSYRTNRTRITVSYNLLFTSEEIKKTSVRELENKLVNALAFDEYEYQKTALVPVNGNRRAECLEILGFTCPSCKGINTIKSRKNEAHCRVCGFMVEVNAFGFPGFPQGPMENIGSFSDWDDWQKSYWKEHLPMGAETVIFEDRDIELYISIDRKPLEKVGAGTMILYPDRMEIHNTMGDSFVFSLKMIQGLNVFKQRYLEFYFDKIAYHVKFTDRHASAYKWTVFYHLLMESAPEDKD
jgi:1-acyl-sn-glycerol-3-phosphate acyltransferase